MNISEFKGSSLNHLLVTYRHTPSQLNAPTKELKMTTPLTLKFANSLVAHAIEKAEEIGINICVAVTDSGAHLKALSRMDEVMLGATDIAIKKAKTSTLFLVPSGNFGQLVRERNLTGFEDSNGGMVGAPGGLPITIEGVKLGAIGISGGTGEQDNAIAEYALTKASL